MKKIIVGVVWFFVFQTVIGFILGLVMSGFSAAISKGHAPASFNKFFPLISLVSLVLAIWGTAKGKLPGTTRGENVANKDTGIVVLASAFIALGILAFALVLPTIISGPGNNPPAPGAKEVMILNLILFGIGWVIAGVLVLARMEWSRRATMAIVSIMILRISLAEVKSIMMATSTPSLIEKAFFSTYTWTIAFLIFGIYYLTRPKIREQFK